MAKELRRISAGEFARRLKRTSEQPDKRFAFFLGAGCSASSGIPASAELVKDIWLPRFRDLRAPHRKDLDEWTREEFPLYDLENPGALYGAVMDRLFLQAEERQREVEALCDMTFPGFGYATLASLITMERGCFNIVLTTNFDDLMADAIYLFTSARPLVIHHESLASFIRPTRTRPLIVKLHGDNRLAPRNTVQETASLKEDIEKQIRTILQYRGIIFVGYGGNDAGIQRMLETLPPDALPLGVFWISGEEPQCALRPWLDSRGFSWVRCGDFDELMLTVKEAFDLSLPHGHRFEQLFKRILDVYRDTFKGLVRQHNRQPGGTADLRDFWLATSKRNTPFPEWWSVIAAATPIEQTDSDQAERVYKRGIDELSHCAPLLNRYAVFLKNIRRDYQNAELYYKQSLELDSSDIDNLGNYALFLKNIRKDFAQAESYFKMALQTGQKSPKILNNYATLLLQVHKDARGAETYYRQALDVQPNYSYSLSNLAGLLLTHGSASDGLLLLRRALRLPFVNWRTEPAAECWFYALVHFPDEEFPEVIKNLKKVMVKGARSPQWNLDDHVSLAKDRRHPYAHWISKLAAVISHDVDISSLDEWSEWREADVRELE